VAALTAAEQVLADLGITDPSEIDLEAIAWTLGARVRYRPLESCEARIVGNGDRAIITVNNRSHPRRQRFSIAHELAIGATIAAACWSVMPMTLGGLARAVP
jgi:Zn-dependent peptidase ImmA (M78 family)